MRFKLWLELIHLPKVEQSHKYDCGAAALRSICQYFGVGPDQEDDFIAILGSNERGTSHEDIVRVARHFGLNAAAQEHLTLEDLLRCLDAKIPMICAIQAWGDEQEYDRLRDGHYVVAIGYDDHHIFFEDPSIHDHKSRGHLPQEEFIRRWVDTSLDGKTRLDHLGIVVWADKPPEETRKTHQAQKIEVATTI